MRPTRWRPTSTARSRNTAGARASAASSRAARCRTCRRTSFPTDDGGVDMKCPTEIAIADRREAELAKNGFMPLVHRKNSDFAAFIGAQSLHKPAEYDDPDATANANLAARLPYLFATCRFAHYLKCIVRDKIGSFKERARGAALAAELDHAVRRRRPGQFVRRRPRRSSRWPPPRWWSRRIRPIPATTAPSSSCVRITSSKDSRCRCGWSRSCLRPRAPERRAVSIDCLHSQSAARLGHLDASGAVLQSSMPISGLT